MKPYLVVTKECYTDPTSVLTHPDGEFGGEGWMEFKKPKEAVLGIFHASEYEEAIEAAATLWEVSPKVLTSYVLAKL